MHYPVFQTPVIGNSLLIAAVAIVHVVIAHFAVGAGLFMATSETLARRRGDEVMLRFLKSASKFLVLFPFIAGAVTGVGIWFTIALIAPRATSNLIHLFVWAWATEWVFFIVESAAGHSYYYTWDRMSPRNHVRVGWIYAISSFGSLFIINGIISFQLTVPADFAGIDSFWSNLFNASFWPSLFIRTISCVALAAIFVMILVNYLPTFDREQKHRVIRSASKWLLPLVLMAPLGWWYFQVVPEVSREYIFKQGAQVMVMLFTFGMVASVLLAAYAYFGLLRAGRFINGESALLLLGVAIIATGSMEFVREGIRKPWLMYGQLYSTQMTPAEMRQTERLGTLASPDADQPGGIDRWHVRTGDLVADGRKVFTRQCYACHTADEAYHPLAPIVKGWTDQQYDANLANLHATSEAMPHYEPSPYDRKALTAFLKSLNRNQ
jgi:cytochrome bd-type quinol oxidase subunit 1